MSGFVPSEHPFPIEHPAVFRPHPMGDGGEQYRFTFSNGYGASVVRHGFSYGGAAGLWELAVLDSEGDLTYDTPITSDVLGWLTEEAVAVELRAIGNLTTTQEAQDG